jgi:ribosomal protein S6--L-glutamate ligase
MKRVLIVGQDARDANNSDLEHACDKDKHVVTRCEYRDLKYVVEKDGLMIFHKNVDLISVHDVFILRGAGIGRAQYMLHRGVIARELLARNKRVLNGEYFVRFCGRADKLTQHTIMAQVGLPVLPSTVLGSVTMLAESVPKAPFVAKLVFGSHGKGVRKVVDDTGLAISYSHGNAQEIMLQPVINASYDYRLIVMGDQVLGGIKRTALEDEFVTNISAGGKAEGIRVSKRLGSLALRVAKELDLEFAGVDIMEDRDGLVVLEVNAQAEFQGFKKATGINVADEIIKYLLKSLE